MNSHPRVVAGVFIATGFAVIAVTVLMYSFGDRVLQARSREQSRRELIANLNRIVSTLRDAETGQRGFLITGDETQLQPFNDAARSLAETLGKIKEAQPPGFSRDSTQTIVKLVQEKMAELRSAIDLRRNGDIAAAVSAVKSGQGAKSMEDLRRTIGDLEQEQTR